MTRNGIARGLAAALLAALPVLIGCMSKAQKHLYRAEDLAEKRDFKGAQAELREALADDPNLLDAHKSLAHVDEILGDYDEAGKEYQIASAMEPADQKLLSKAHYYGSLQQIGQQANKALDEVKAGDAEKGMKDLKAALAETKSPSSRKHVTDDIGEAIPAIVQQGDKLTQDGKYVDAAKAYELAVRGYLLLAGAGDTDRLDPAADGPMRSAGEAARRAGAPDVVFRLLNDVLALDPDNKIANLELARVHLRHDPPDYGTAADLLERAGAPEPDVEKLRALARRHG